MKAYEVKYGTKVRVIDENVKTPPASLQINKDGDIVYISGGTQVELCEG